MNKGLSEQLAMCESYGVLPMTPTAGEKLGIAIASLDRDPIHGLRLSPEGGTCGWYIYGGMVLKILTSINPFMSAISGSTAPQSSLTFRYPPVGASCWEGMASSMCGSMRTCFRGKSRELQRPFTLGKRALLCGRIQQLSYECV